MALYLGSEKVKLNLDGARYFLNLSLKAPITNGIRLLSSEGIILKDSDGLYLTAKESE
jgi:hypothetical protein